MGFDAEQLLQAASSMRGEHFQMMDADSAYAMIETIDIQQALALEGERLAGIFGAMDDVQITGFSGEELFDAAAAKSEEHFQFMDTDSAFGIFTGMGLDEALNLDGGQPGGNVQRDGRRENSRLGPATKSWR